MKTILFLMITCSAAYAQVSKTVDGSQFYGLPKGSVTCEIIPVIEKYKSFVGTWKGPFQAYDRKTNGMISYDNTIIYENFCYRNTANNDIFIVGKRMDIYHGTTEKKVEGLLITGMTEGNESKPFLRTIDAENGVVEYTKAFTDPVTEMSIWKYELAANGNNPAMAFTITDFRDQLEEKSNKRFVYISMVVGPESKPYWKGIVTKGYHSKE